VTIKEAQRNGFRVEYEYNQTGDLINARVFVHVNPKSTMDKHRSHFVMGKNKHREGGIIINAPYIKDKYDLQELTHSLELAIELYEEINNHESTNLL